MIPENNDGNFSWNSRDRKNGDQNTSKRAGSYDYEAGNDWNAVNSNSSKSQSMDNAIDDRDMGRYSDDRDNGDTPNRTIENSWEARSKTFNQDEDSWEEEKGLGATVSNRGTQDNDWDANNPVQRSTGRNEFDDEQRNMAGDGDYIDSDHSSYNRNNDRYSWNEPEEEEE